MTHFVQRHTKDECEALVKKGILRLRRFAKQCMALAEVSGSGEQDARSAWAAVDAMARETMVDVKAMCRDYYVPEVVNHATKLRDIVKQGLEQRSTS